MLLSLSLQASRVKSSSFFTLWSADHFLHFFVVPVELWSSEIFWCLPLKSGYICLLSVENKETDHKAHYAGSTHCVCVFLAPLPNPFHFSSWCQSHGFQAPRALNQNQIVFLTTLNPPPCWWLAKAHALALSTSISLWTQRTTYQRSDHICSFISWLQEGRCLAWPQMKGSPLLITSMFFLSLLLSRAAPSLSEISLLLQWGNAALPVKLHNSHSQAWDNYRCFVPQVTPPPPSPLGGPHVNVVLKESVCF